MNSYWQLLVFCFAAINPAAAALTMLRRGRTASTPPGWQLAVLGGAIALVVYAIMAALAEKLLDGLEIEAESFRVGAGVIMGAAGAVVLWQGAPDPPGENRGFDAALFPVAIPLLVTPAGLAAAISYGADDGAWKAFFALVVPVVLGVGLISAKLTRWPAALDAIARLTGALLIAVAAGLIVDGVRAI